KIQAYYNFDAHGEQLLHRRSEKKHH
ncbi:MAG: hypothetical protein ACI9YG_002066, partial [Candidatus Azotimanducaceae bacterium]